MGNNTLVKLELLKELKELHLQMLRTLIATKQAAAITEVNHGE